MQCYKCKSLIVAHAFSMSKCKICGDTISSPHIPSYKVCKACSIKHKLCEQCGNELEDDDKEKEMALI